MPDVYSTNESQLPSGSRYGRTEPEFASLRRTPNPPKKKEHRKGSLGPVTDFPSAQGAVCVRVMGPRLLCNGLCAYLRTIANIHLLDSPDRPEIPVPPETDVLVIIATDARDSILPLPYPLRSNGDHYASARGGKPREKHVAGCHGQEVAPSLPPTVVVTDPRSLSPSHVAELQDRTPRFMLVACDEEPAALPRAIRSLFCGPSSPSDTPYSLPVPAPPIALDGLTERQKEVAVLAAGGFSNVEIGARLFVDITTVKSHLTEVFRKLGICRRSQIIGKLTSDWVQSEFRALGDPFVMTNRQPKDFAGDHQGRVLAS